MKQSLTHDIATDEIRKAYTRLDHPDYTFAERRYKQLLRHQIVFDVMARYFVKDNTDLNDHAAVHLAIRDVSGAVDLCLSFVSNWAMLFRLDPKETAWITVIDESVVPTNTMEREMLRLLSRHRFRLLSTDEAMMPIDIVLFNTDKHNTVFFHAAINDCGVIPLVLQ